VVVFSANQSEKAIHRMYLNVVYFSQSFYGWKYSANEDDILVYFSFPEAVGLIEVFHKYLHRSLVVAMFRAEPGLRQFIFSDPLEGNIT